MRARGVTCHIKAVAIAAEAFRILVNPRDGAPHLIRHDHKIAAYVLYRGEVEDDVMGSGVDEYLGRESKVFRRSVAPGAAVSEDYDGCVRPRGPVDVEFFDFSRTVGET